MTTLANLALEGGDPRDVAHPATALHGASPPGTTLLHELHDSSVTFEEYSTFAFSIYSMILISFCELRPRSRT